jgi:hypothetical protein
MKILLGVPIKNFVSLYFLILTIIELIPLPRK